MRTQVKSAQTRWIAAFGVAAVASWGLLASAQQPPSAQQGPMPLDPVRGRGVSITPAYEGWYTNADGSFSMLLGYYNRNTKEALDIPVGPNNKIEPGDPDQGQPTHFEVGRQWGVFTIKVPKDFGTTKAVTWTIVSNGEKQSIPFTLSKGYPIAPYKELGMGNAPPVLSFVENGPKFTGPPLVVANTYSGRVNEPLTLSVWATDPKSPNEEPARGRGGPPPVATISMHKFRGPGKVTFDKARLPVTKQGEMVSATATFSAPGEYLLRVQANDESGEGGQGFQCCWTNAYVKVTIQ